MLGSNIKHVVFDKLSSKAHPMIEVYQAYYETEDSIWWCQKCGLMVKYSSGLKPVLYAPGRGEIRDANENLECID